MKADPFSASAIRAAYDVAAQDYAAAFGDDLDQLPLDRAMLEEAAALARPSAPALDLGCGPGTVASYLRVAGLLVAGLDLSQGMLAVARERDLGVPVVQGDMRTLPFRSGSFALVVSYYALQHLPRGELRSGLDEVGRVLVPDGLLLLATHLGQGDVASNEFLGHHVEAFGGALYEPGELVGRWRMRGS